MTQAEVVDTNTETPESSAAVENAQEPSLDELLSGYEEPVEAPVTEAPKAAPIPADVQTFMERQIKKDNDQAITEAAKVMQETIGETPLSSKWFEGQLHLAASRDPRVTEAFIQREQNPSKWEQVVKAIGNELKSEIKPVDASATESWKAVETSVRSASTSAPKETPSFSEKDLKKMSDAEFETFRKEQGFKR